MFEGIGIMTLLGVFGTVGVGALTPLDCYVGVAGRTNTEDFDIENPYGTLGCQYDIGNARPFVEHISSPAVGNDHPGINHAGVKGLLPLDRNTTVYVGTSVAMPSDQLKDHNLLGMGGIEHGEGPVKVYGEYITSWNDPDGGTLHGGVKFIF